MPGLTRKMNLSVCEKIKLPSYLSTCSCAEFHFKPLHRRLSFIQRLLLERHQIFQNEGFI